MKRFASICAIALLALCVAPALLAQESDVDLRSDIEDLKRGQQHIQEQLQEIRKLIAARPAAAPSAPRGPNVADKEFDLADNAVEGQVSARLTLIEFTDYQ